MHLVKLLLLVLLLAAAAFGWRAANVVARSTGAVVAGLGSGPLHERMGLMLLLLRLLHERQVLRCL